MEVLKPKYTLPDTGRMVSYTTYRNLTGRCETCGEQMKEHPTCEACGEQMKEHPTCEACGILYGSGHQDSLPAPYREHNLCGHCTVFWERLDRLTGRKTIWNEFLTPRLLEKGGTMHKPQLYHIKKMPPEEPFQHKIVTIRKARKVHTCAHCHQPINKGEMYCEAVAGGSGLGGLKFPDRTHRDCIDEFLRR